MSLIFFAIIIVASAKTISAVDNESDQDYFNRLQLLYSNVADCNHTSVNYTGYKEFIELDKLKDSRPVGYLANVTVFIIGPKDAHVLFSTSDKITIYDNVYEIVIGAYYNTRSVIRRKMLQSPIGWQDTLDIMSEQHAIKVQISITEKGQISVYADNDLVVSANDPRPLPIKYVSFGSYDNAKNDYLFNCKNNILKCSKSFS